MSGDNYAKKSAALEKDIMNAKVMIHKINVVQNPFAHLRNVLQPNHLQKIFLTMYQSIIIGLATVHSQAIGTLTKGIHIGQVLSNRVTNIFQAQHEDDDETESAAELFSEMGVGFRTVLNVVSRGVGIILSFALDETLGLISACSLGSDIVLNSIQSLIDPILIKLKIPTMKATPAATAAAHTALIVLGVRSQIFRGHAHDIPVILRLPLAPLLAVEFFLKKMVMTNTLF